MSEAKKILLDEVDLEAVNGGSWADIKNWFKKRSQEIQAAMPGASVGLVCSRCRKPIDGSGSYQIVSGKLVCASCLGLTMDIV